MKYKVKKSDLTDSKNQVKKIGEEIEVSEADAKVLIEKGLISKISNSAPKKEVKNQDNKTQGEKS